MKSGLEVRIKGEGFYWKNNIIPTTRKSRTYKNLLHIVYITLNYSYYKTGLRVRKEKERKKET